MLYQLSYFRIRRTGAKINSFPVSAKFFFIKVQYSQRDLNPQNLLPAQQLFLRSLHGLKIETIYHFLHQGRDFIVAKVSDTAFMGMVYLFAVREVSGFNMNEIKVNEHILDDDKYLLIFSVEEVNRLAREGMPFRDAYKKVGLDIEA